jgi:hypothetical protein
VHEAFDGGEGTLGEKLGAGQRLPGMTVWHHGVSCVGGPTLAKYLSFPHHAATHLGIEYNGSFERWPPCFLTRD